MRGPILSLVAVLTSVAHAGTACAHEVKSAVAASGRLSPAANGAATVVDSFHRALQRGDVITAAALLADDALIYESGGVEQSKAEYASHHLQADAAFSRTVIHRVTRRSGQANADFAWIATEATMTGNYKNRIVNIVSTETMVLRRVGAAWRIVHIHWSSANQK